MIHVPVEYLWTLPVYAPWGYIYSSSIFTIPIDSIFTPDDPYALQNSHAVWAMSCTVLIGGLTMFFCSGIYKKYPKKTALYGGICWTVGMILNGVALQIGSNPSYRSIAIAIYYGVHIILLGPFVGPRHVSV